MGVAPFAGAWIETELPRVSITASDTSPPSRGRGLKRFRQRNEHEPAHVAPFAGAWIETSGLTCS